MIPICTALYTAGIVKAKREEKREEVAIPLYGFSLVQGPEVWRRTRRVKYNQKTLDLG